jgi:hypothetical protein
MVNYRTLLLQGREPVRTVLIELVGDDGLTGAERIRLLSHLYTHLRGYDLASGAGAPLRDDADRR